jgi:hypothetical protein
LASHGRKCPLAGCDSASHDAYIEKRLADIHEQRLVLPTEMPALAELATALSDAVHTDATTAELVRPSAATLRRLAQAALLQPGGGETDHESPRRQVFRIAYAVFHGHSLSEVFDAGELLSQQILPLFEQRAVTPNSIVFETGLKELLYDHMYADAPVVGDPSESGPRRARLIDPDLAPMMLDVAWHDLAASRGPLQAWLNVLAGADRVQLRIRAAQAAGVLATYDFEAVYGALIGRWARGRVVYRQSAVFALDVAVADPRLVARVRRQVRSWQESPNAFLKDTAARAYGLRIGIDTPEDAITELHNLAQRGELNASDSIAAAMATLYSSGADSAVLDALPEWTFTKNDNLRRHAVRLLLVLARVAGPKPREPWTPVISHLGQDEARQAAVVELWRYALVGSQTASRAWEPLRRWMVSADADPGQADLVVSLATRILTVRGTERERFEFGLRAGFHLNTWSRRYPDSTVIRRVRRELKVAR